MRRAFDANGGIYNPPPTLKRGRAPFRSFGLFPVGMPGWMWTLAFWHHEDRTPTHGCAATREAARAAFAKSWRTGIGPFSVPKGLTPRRSARELALVVGCLPSASHGRQT